MKTQIRQGMDPLIGFIMTNGKRHIMAIIVSKIMKPDPTGRKRYGDHTYLMFDTPDEASMIRIMQKKIRRGFSGKDR